MRVINMYGGPGTGKSTTAAGLFYLMKLQHMEVELVTEYAKDLVWSQRHNMFTEQDYIFAKQNHKLRRLVMNGKVDWAVTDSPLIIGQFYTPKDFPGREHFLKFVDATFNSYNNVNIFLNRVKVYNPNGRNQTEKEAREIDNQILDMLSSQNVDFHVVDADIDAPHKILELVEALT